MKEIKQNWEEEFDEQFKLWSGCRVDEEGYIIPELNNNRLKDFIHKVRTEAILEERKRIEEEVVKLDRERPIRDFITIMRELRANGKDELENCLEADAEFKFENAKFWGRHNALQDVLQIINNKNI